MNSKMFFRFDAGGKIYMGEVAFDDDLVTTHLPEMLRTTLREVAKLNPELATARTLTAIASLDDPGPESLEQKQDRLLRWFIAQFEGDSGTGRSHWEQFPEFREALEITQP